MGARYAKGRFSGVVPGACCRTNHLGRARYLDTRPLPCRGHGLTPEEQWPAWEALALRCLPVAGTRLGRPGNWLRVRAGWLWSVSMVRQEREYAAYAWARPGS